MSRMVTVVKYWTVILRRMSDAFQIIAKYGIYSIVELRACLF